MILDSIRIVTGYAIALPLIIIKTLAHIERSPRGTTKVTDSETGETKLSIVTVVPESATDKPSGKYAERPNRVIDVTDDRDAVPSSAAPVSRRGQASDAGERQSRTGNPKRKRRTPSASKPKLNPALPSVINESLYRAEWKQYDISRERAFQWVMAGFDGKPLVASRLEARFSKEEDQEILTAWLKEMASQKSVWTWLPERTGECANSIRYWYEFTRVAKEDPAIIDRWRKEEFDAEAAAKCCKFGARSPELATQAWNAGITKAEEIAKFTG